MDKKFLGQLGFDYYDINDFYKRQIVLRDGRDSTLYVHEPTGHGILDRKFWVDEEFYTGQYRKEFSANMEGKRKECEEHLRIYNKLNTRQFELFKKCLAVDTRYLEVGCSFGGVVSKVSNYGVKECHVVEPNVEDAQFVTNTFDNIKVFNTTFNRTDLEKNYYDIIVAFDVIEHVFTPGSFFKKCYDALRVGGRLVIAVPNHNDILLTYYDCDKYKEFYYHKAHINYFTSESIVDLGESVGFDGNVNSFLDYSFFNHVHWYQNNKPMGSGDTAFIGDVMKGDEFTTQINNFYKNVELEYEKLVNEHMVGGALIYKGIKNV